MKRQESHKNFSGSCLMFSSIEGVNACRLSFPPSNGTRLLRHMLLESLKHHNQQKYAVSAKAAFGQSQRFQQTVHIYLTVLSGAGARFCLRRRLRPCNSRCDRRIPPLLLVHCLILHGPRARGCPSIFWSVNELRALLPESAG